MNVFAVMAEILQLQLESPVGLAAHNLPHLLQKQRLAVGRQPHHLVFIAKMRETKVLGQSGVENSQ